MSHVRLGRGSNWHHVWFSRRDYEDTANERLLRSHPAFVVPMLVRNHNLLHQEVLPPPKPSEEQMAHVLGRIALWTPMDGRLTGIVAAIRAFEEMNDPEIADNLSQQLTYMETNRGRVTQPVYW